MPKEIVKEHPGSEAYVEVRWGAGHFGELQICIDRGEGFRFVDELNDVDNVFTGLCLTFDSGEDVDRFIKNLRKARRKTFG